MFRRHPRGRHALGRSERSLTVPFILDRWRGPAPRRPRSGPFDSEVAPDDGVSRLDLGSVRLPVPDGAQLQVEVSPAGPVRAVHVVTGQGQLTVNAFAAPRGAELWNEVRRELVAQLSADGARVSEETGEWGREVLAVRSDVVLRFVGVDGPRWLLRGVAAGAAEHTATLARLLRDMLRGTVVVRGQEPVPPRAALPVVLPESMAARVKRAVKQDVAARAAEPDGQAPTIR